MLRFGQGLVSEISEKPLDTGSRRATVWGLGSDNAVHIWDLETTKEITGMPAGSAPYRDFASTTDGRTVALAFEGVVILRDTERGSEQRLLQLRKDAYTSVTTLAISEDDSLLVSGDTEGYIDLWNLPVRDDLEFTTIDKVSSLGSTVLFPDGLHLLSTTGSADPITPTLVKIDVVNNVVDMPPIQLPNQVAPNALAIDPKSRYILVGGGNLDAIDAGIQEEPFLWILNAENGEVLHKLQGHLHNVMAVAISPDGNYALSGSAFRLTGSLYSDTSEFILWDMETSQQVKQFAYNTDIQGVAFSHDGKMAVTCSQMGYLPSLTVWEIATGKQLYSFPYGCLDAIFSLDDKSILINAMTDASLNRIYQINTDSGEVERRFEGLDSPILSFDVSPDGRYLFAASQTTAALWDLQSGQELSSFLLPTPGSETRAAFPSASDSAVIVQDNTNQLIQWRINALPTLANLRIWILKNRYLRLLTCEERDLFEVQPYCGE